MKIDSIEDFMEGAKHFVVADIPDYTKDPAFLERVRAMEESLLRVGLPKSFSEKPKK